MFPLFFGDRGHELYGVYHMHEGDAPGPVGVVLCQPVLHEYADARRALRALAESLARAGFHVLRFDYRGTGDSQGAGDQCDVAGWTTDIETAIEELKASRGLSSVGLVGLRFGATLAAQVAARRGDVPFMVLWEPIVKGRPYLQFARSQHRAWLQAEAQQRPEAPQRTTEHEVLGQLVSATLADGLARMELPPPRGRLAESILLVDEGACEQIDSLARHLTLRGADVSHVRRAGGRIWQRERDGEQAPVPREIVAEITRWVGARAVAS